MLHSALDLLKSVWISSYLFPVVVGVWAAFFTANLIMLRTARARTVAALNNLRWELIMLRATTFDELSQKIFRFGQPILDIADELEANGYIETARTCRGSILAIQNPMAQFVQTFSFGAGPTSPEAVQAVLGSLVEKAVPVICEYVPKAVLAVREQPVEWLAVLELTTLNAMIVKHGGGRRSDGDHLVL